MESDNKQINVTINGEPRSVTAGQSLDELLQDLELDPRMVVVEHNQVIVKRPNLAGTRLGDGDKIELVHFVGGG